MSDKKDGSSSKKPARFCSECKQEFAYKNWSRHRQRRHHPDKTVERSPKEMEQPTLSRVRLIRRCAARAGALFAYNHSRKIVEDSVKKRDKDLSTGDQLLCIEAADAIIINIRHHMNNATIENPVPVATGCTGSPVAMSVSKKRPPASISSEVAIGETQSRPGSEIHEEPPLIQAELSEPTQQKSELDKRIDDIHASVGQSSQESVFQSSQPREPRIAKEKYTPKKKKKGKQRPKEQVLEDSQVESQVIEGEEASSLNVEQSNAGSADIILGAEEEDSAGEDDPFSACVLSRSYHVAQHAVTAAAPLAAASGEKAQSVRPGVESVVCRGYSVPTWSTHGHLVERHIAPRDRNNNRRDTFRLEPRRSSPRRDRRGSRSPFVSRRRSPSLEHGGWHRGSRRDEELERQRRELEDKLRSVSREINDRRKSTVPDRR